MKRLHAQRPNAGRVAIVIAIVAGVIPATTSQGQQEVTQRVELRETPQQARLPLHHIAPQDLEKRLIETWGSRMRPSHSTPTGTVLTAPGRHGTPIEIYINRETRSVELSGGAGSLAIWSRVIQTIDDGAGGNVTGQAADVVAPRAAPDAMRRVVALLQQGLPAGSTVQMLRAGRVASSTAISGLLQENGNESGAGNTPQRNNSSGAPQVEAAAGGGVLGQVQLEFLEGIDGVLIRGNPRDVERVRQIISEIERISAETEPEVKVLPLQHINSQAVGELVNELYQQVLSSRQGPVSITPLVKPNALLLIGRDENVKVVEDLVRQLDQPVAPDTEFRLFRLRHMAALDAVQTITDFYEERGGLGPRVRVVSDYRTNSVVVQAGPRDIVEIERLLERMDSPESAAVSEVRVFPLKNALAEELVPVLEEAFQIDEESLQGSTGGGGFGGFGGGQSNRPIQPRSTILTLSQLDADGKRLLRSGILADASVSADPRSNALVVRAPAESMDLIAELVKQLDALPGAEAQIKVFAVTNGDAVSLTEMLQELFGEEGNQTGPAIQTGGVGEEGSLVPLRFTVDERTNTIIASGSVSDLDVVEAILLRLDQDDVRQRRNSVYRLRNSSAQFVADAINEFLRSEREVQDINPAALSPFEQIEREVVVVAETESNSLIISATPRFYDEIMDLIRRLDERRPMVMIQVLIAEVTLNDLEEFGVELGIQDSLLFDRGISTTGGLVPGFAFNNQPLGNQASPQSLASREDLGGQALSNFSLGRTNSQLGYGGLVLSASSESINVLVRALEQEGRLNVLSRPQIMTLDNRQGSVLVGQEVPYISSSNVVTGGTVINSTTFRNTGIELVVTPSISPDNIVTMGVVATKSSVGRVEDGIPISINDNGDVIRAPIFNTTTANTAISCRSGQTVVLSGLITTEHSETHRGVPWVSDIPLLGRLFRYDNVSETRTELLFILTPYVVRNEHDIEAIKAVELERMHWCLRDVIDVHGDPFGYGSITTSDMPGTSMGSEIIEPGVEWHSAPSAVYPEQIIPSQVIPGQVGPEIVPGGSVPPTPESTRQGDARPMRDTFQTTMRPTQPNELVSAPPRRDQPGRAIGWTLPDRGQRVTNRYPVQPTASWQESTKPK